MFAFLLQRSPFRVIATHLPSNFASNASNFASNASKYSIGLDDGIISVVVVFVLLQPIKISNMMKYFFNCICLITELLVANPVAESKSNIVCVVPHQTHIQPLLWVAIYPNTVRHPSYILFGIGVR